MSTSMNRNQENKKQKDEQRFNEVNEFNHDRNPVSKAQKQAASQETAGLLDKN